jgi:hypothetical protein
MHLKKKDIIIQFLGWFSIIYSIVAIPLCSVVNSTNSSICDVCDTGKRLTLSKTICA